MRGTRPLVEPDEGIAAAALFGWAVLLIGPADVFDSGPSFATMQRAMREPYWGAGAVVIVYLFLIGVSSQIKAIHLFALTLMAAWWLGCAGMLYDAGGLTGPIMYGLVGVACLCRVFVRAAR